MCGDFNACYHKQQGGPKIRPAKTDNSATIIVERVVSGAADASVESNANSGNVALITMNKKQPSKALKKTGADDKEEEAVAREARREEMATLRWTLRHSNLSAVKKALSHGQHIAA